VWLPFTWRAAINPGGLRNGHAGGCASRASFVDAAARVELSGCCVELELLTRPLVQPLGSAPTTAKVTATTNARVRALLPR
jgi:hypothetical protein